MPDQSPTLLRAAVRGLLGLAALAMLAACSSPPAPAPIGGFVRVLGSWELPGPEYDAFRAVVAPFEKRTGYEVKYSPTRDLQRVLETGLRSGTVPDVAGLPGPGYLTDFARAGALVDLTKVIDVGQYKRETAPAFVDLGTVDGKLAGVFIKATVKSLIWYNPEVWKYGQPATWSELFNTAMHAADTTRPWCVGLGSAASSGWPGTDWIEDFVLRQSGPDIYDGWVAGKVRWSSPQIRKAFLAYGSVVADGAVAGGQNEAIQTHFSKAGDGLFGSPPRCLLMHQGSFITSYLDDAVKRLGGSYDFMPFPPIDGRYEDALIGAGDLFALFQDSPGGRELIRYLVSGEAQSIWVKSGGALSGNMTVTGYPTSVARREAQLLATASVFRFDASDTMPDVMNTAFWQAVLNFTAKQTDLDDILANLDAVQATAYR
jgi:alpha-glucoside transport system substrate-binding protein